MNTRLLLASAALALTAGCATNTPNAITELEHNHTMMPVSGEPKYNPVMNPRQIEHPNVMGFNDLHIQAIRHLKPDVMSIEDPKLHAIVHHHCKAYDDGTLVCLMFPSGMKDQDKPIGFEYIIPTAQYNTLPAQEKHYWHYHKTEVGRACATFPDLTKEEANTILPTVHETYGKVVYFQKPEDKIPLGEPYVLIVQDMPDVKQ
ncbi:conserved exported hypothetical protein [Crenothrix polyspora]|uniref:DUF1264 domain-containing protein n=1 Tax=Crenothrix polyspora TaxID=360316 RepID=A0A1R4HFM4_9GAMM|nr:DUF1264 domain-containing protein [Crenothrix polyspora]SJM95022.1 conserved exported hypothetical protein [Crenothrix polyspora]